MTVIHKKAFLAQQKKYLPLIKKGSAFIYPTDTIYGIGCDATNSKAVRHVHALKHREHKPFSVIVPSQAWILENCVVDAHVKRWLGKLPGKYTLILRMKNKKAVSSAVHLGDYTLGVRIPKHWFAAVVAQYGKPIVTTSVNISGEPYMRVLADIPGSLKKKIGFIVYEGPKKAHPSTLVDFVAEKNGTIVKRKK
jgi:L-threonylcarbamoyladenylate synthase